MGSRILRGVRFQVYSGDLEGSRTPHVHAHYDEGDVDIEIYPDNSVGVSTSHKRPIDPGMKKSQVKRALKIAQPRLTRCLISGRRVGTNKTSSTYSCN